MSEEEDDPLLRDLARLPARPIDDLTGERVRRRAQAILDGERQLRARPWLRVWSRSVAPALLAGAVGFYLWWSVSFTAALYGTNDHREARRMNHAASTIARAQPRQRFLSAPSSRDSSTLNLAPSVKSATTRSRIACARSALGGCQPSKT
jgi:hypothetical protein